MNRIISRQNDNYSHISMLDSLLSRGIIPSKSYIHNRTVMKNADITLEFSMKEIKQIELIFGTC